MKVTEEICEYVVYEYSPAEVLEVLREALLTDNPHEELALRADGSLILRWLRRREVQSK